MGEQPARNQTIRRDLIVPQDAKGRAVVSRCRYVDIEHHKTAAHLQVIGVDGRAPNVTKHARLFIAKLEKCPQLINPLLTRRRFEGDG